MDDLTRKLLQSPLALAVFGIKQGAKTLTEGGWLPADTYVMKEWHSAFQYAEHRLGQVMNEAMSLGDHVHRGGVFAGLHYALQTAESLLADETDHLVWQEAQNRMTAFGAFAYAETRLQVNLDLDTELHLNRLVANAAALDPYSSVWVTEGLGHYFVGSHIRQGYLARNLLREERMNTLPERALIPLHAGMGLALAESVCEGLSESTSRTDLRRAFRRFVDLCRSNAREGFAGVALEGFGLVARTLHPYLIPAIDATLAEEDHDLLALFWHGVGRGLYFLPTQFLPLGSTVGHIADQIRQEAPHQLALNNMMAGFAWPVTLVNIRTPAVIERYLKAGFSRNTTQRAFAQGMRAALITWRDASPADPSVQGLLAYQPDQSDTATTAFWSSQIRIAGEKAIQNSYPEMKRNGRLDLLFRYQTGNIW